MYDLSSFILKKGETVSNGYAEGKALIIESSTDFKKVQNVSEKIVMIVKNFEPHFDVLLDYCLGVISEMGNMLCHLAIVSRIRNIPAIVKARSITNSVKDFEKVTLDAYRGIVYRGYQLNKLKIDNNLDFINDFYSKIDE